MNGNSITFDPNYLYINQERFFPILQEAGGCLDSLESVNGVVVRVNLTLDQDSFWDEAARQAEIAASNGKWILWDLDFGFQEKRVFLQDSSLFFANGMAVQEFLDKLWAPFKEQTIGVSLFRGSVDFSKYFVWTELHEEYYLEKQLERPLLQSEDLFCRKLFAADVFSSYLHRLSSFFPEEILPFCLLDVSAIESNAELSFLLSKERFQHLLLALKKSEIPLGYLNWEEGGCLGGWIGRGAPYFSTTYEIKIGVCLPLEEKVCFQLLKQLDFVFDELSEKSVSYRVIAETYLNESWDGIDELIVFSSAVSPLGLRKLRGFLAAGGRVVFIGDPLGLEEEVSFEEFLQTVEGKLE